MDGRHARRERGQQAVIDAVFELIQEGNLAPSVEEVGARAGISVATIFRNYGTLDELARQLTMLFRERFGELFIIPQAGEGPLSERISQFCDARIVLYEAIWPFVRFMTVRAAKHTEAIENLGLIREILVHQVHQQFKAEMSDVSHTESLNLVASIDALTSPESWALLQNPHTRTTKQIKRIWSKSITSLLTGSV